MNEPTKGKKDDKPASPVTTTVDHVNLTSAQLISQETTTSSSNSASVSRSSISQSVQPTNSLSKNQQKKIQRWERKIQLKQRRKQQDKDIRHARAKAQGRDLVEEQRIMRLRTEEGSTKRRRIMKFQTEKIPLVRASFQIGIDCSFEHRLSSKEIGSLAKQLRYCYSINRKSPHPCLLTITSLGGETLDQLQNVSGFDEWATFAFCPTSNTIEKHFADQMKDLIYLTSDSQTTIDYLDNSKIYVIGGIVDRNRMKGTALERAHNLNLATAKLPLCEHLHAMRTTPVLAVNHVFEILLKYRENDCDWRKALEIVIPQRKLAHMSSTINSKGTVSDT